MDDVFKKFLITVFLIILTYFQLTTIAQTIQINWQYDENQIFIIDDVYKNALIGMITISSPRRFMMYIVPTILDGTGVAVSNIRIGNTTISRNPAKPTKINSGRISGNLFIQFSYENVPNDFRVRLSFTFLAY
ncbi:hypothetical protein [Fervidobacterium sp.]